MNTALKNDVVGNKLRGKRVVLASASARRKEILEDCLGWTGFEVIPSSFDETLSHHDYAGREIEYPVDTAAQKVIDCSGMVVFWLVSCLLAGRHVQAITSDMTYSSMIYAYH